MKVTLTYKAQANTTKDIKQKMDATLAYYQDMLTYLTPIIEKEYHTI